MHKSKLRMLSFLTTEKLNFIYSKFCPAHCHTHTYSSIRHREALNTEFYHSPTKACTGPRMRSVKAPCHVPQGFMVQKPCQSRCLYLHQFPSPSWGSDHTGPAFSQKWLFNFCQEVSWDFDRNGSKSVE